jgi:hypothetical protein
MFFVFLGILASGVGGEQASAPMPTLWMDPVNAHRPRTISFSGSLINKAEVKRETMEKIEQGLLTQQAGRIAVIVESSIYSAISASLSTYIDDLAEMGFSNTVITFSGDAEYLRSTLMALYNEPASLVGAVLIGNLPYIIYEMNQNWGSGSEYEDFACDLYFMDMDGEWLDALNQGAVQPNNGKLDTWLDNDGLEIWVSRMRADNLTSLGFETDLLNSYFTRNHALRINLLNGSLTGLVYNDDDWEYLAGDDTDSMKRVFGSGNVITVSDPEATTAADYINQRLTANYHLDLIRSHGSPASHGFYRDGRTHFDYVLRDNYMSSDPAAVFFSLYVCSGCDYATTNYLGGITVFNPEANGLLAWGSTKTGGMWGDDYLYSKIAAGRSVGEAFKYWFNRVKVYYSNYAPRYWYGMVLVGDASLASATATAGDFQPDGSVDLYDFAILASAWLSSPGQTNWNPVCDISEPKDNIIDEWDLCVLTSNWLDGTSQ